MKKINVTLIQDAPIFFNKELTLQKIEAQVQTEADTSDLIVFPESYVPGYPRGLDFGTTIGSRTAAGRSLYRELYDSSFSVEEDAPRIEKLAKETSTFIILGVTEKVKKNNSLFCSMAYFSPEDGLIGIHRKIKPTGQERVIWSESDGSSLVSFDTPIGKLGGLICWENYMPLARMSMFQMGVEIYLAPTADARNSWTTSMQHIALEGRCFVLSCNQQMNLEDYPASVLDMFTNPNKAACRGGSMIVSPMGNILSGPVYDRKEVLKAKLNLDEIIESKLDFDPNGHYNRPDIFEFQVLKQPPMKETN